MDREPEKRRDLERAPPGEYKLGGELFTVVETIYDKSPTTGKQIAVARTESRHVPFGSDRKTV